MLVVDLSDFLVVPRWLFPGLRSKNKEINVERQRRREEHERESIADAVKKKDVVVLFVG